MNFGTSNPASTAFFANNPAVKITLGLLLFVEEAIDADSIVPWRNEYSFPSKNVSIYSIYSGQDISKR